MSAESDLFGFENEANEPTVDQIEILPSKRRKFVESEHESNLSITEIQRLLKKDLGDDSVTQDTEDFESSSIFEDTETSYTGLSEVTSSDIHSGLVNSNPVVTDTEETDRELIHNTSKPHQEHSKKNTESEPVSAVLKARIQKKTKKNKENDSENVYNKSDILKARACRNILRNIENTPQRVAIPKTLPNNQTATSPSENVKHQRKLRTRPQRTHHKGKSVEFEDAESSFLMPVTRAYSKHGRQRKVAACVENAEVVDESENTSVVKRKRNTKKGKAKLVEEEKVETIAEEINNKFKKVEEFQLIVE